MGQFGHCLTTSNTKSKNHVHETAIYILFDCCICCSENDISQQFKITIMIFLYFIYAWGNAEWKEDSCEIFKKYTVSRKYMFIYDVHRSPPCALQWWLTMPGLVSHCPWLPRICERSLQWRHNGHDRVSNHQPHNCLLNRLFGRRSKKTSKLRVAGLCAGKFTGDRWIPRTKGQ